VVMDVFTRRIIGFGIERADPRGASICRMFNQIIAGKSLPRHLSSDHDPLFRFHRWLANLRILEVEEIKSIPFVPASHPFVERLIGTIRREFLDHVLIWNSIDLERKLEEFRIYYNEHRVHQSLSGGTPGERSGKPPPAHAALDHYAWRHHCRGLFQIPDGRRTRPEPALLGPTIGIGGSLATPPLPHHRTYGSVYGGSRVDANALLSSSEDQAI
jgi:putative transposase